MDYNIYIRNLTEGGDNRKPTQPKVKNTSMTSAKTKDKKVNTTSSGGFAVNLKNLKKIKAVAKGGAAALTIMAAVAITRKVFTVANEVAGMYAMDTGDYKLQTHTGNLLAGLNAVTNPLSQFKNDIVNMRQRQIENEKREQSRLLLGDTFVNSSIRRM